MTKKQLFDIIERAMKTFVQTFLVIFVPALIAYLNGTGTMSVKAVIAPAAAAGISAVWNWAKHLLEQKTPEEEEKEAK